MDITKTSFYPLLLDILTDISESYFVAFDLELSGVPVKQPSANRRVGRPSLQERYQEVKEAAESCKGTTRERDLAELRGGEGRAPNWATSSVCDFRVIPVLPQLNQACTADYTACGAGSASVNV